jgi:hypothetical protein
MSPTLKIAREITRLPLKKMVALHEELIATIHRKEEEEGLEARYLKELKRRVSEVKSGRAKGAHASRALKRM